MTPPPSPSTFHLSAGSWRETFSPLDIYSRGKSGGAEGVARKVIIEAYILFSQPYYSAVIQKIGMQVQLWLPVTYTATRG